MNKSLTSNMRGIFSPKIVLIIMLVALSGLVPGCDSITDEDSDDEGTIYIYNYDEDHEYQVRLYLYGDDTYVDSLWVDEYPDDGYIDSFTDVDENIYYLVIYKDSASEETGRSATFQIEEEETLYFGIDEDGEIEKF